MEFWKIAVQRTHGCGFLEQMIFEHKPNVVQKHEKRTFLGMFLFVKTIFFLEKKP